MYVFVYLCIMERTHLIREHLFAKGPCIWSIKVAFTRGGWNAYIQRSLLPICKGRVRTF